VVPVGVFCFPFDGSDVIEEAGCWVGWIEILCTHTDKIKGRGTWLKPRQAPEGIEYVLVNGKVVYEKMKHTGLKPGKVLRHKK